MSVLSGPIVAFLCVMVNVGVAADLKFSSVVSPCRDTACWPLIRTCVRQGDKQHQPLYRVTRDQRFDSHWAKAGALCFVFHLGVTIRWRAFTFPGTLISEGRHEEAVKQLGACLRYASVAS